MKPLALVIGVALVISSWKWYVAFEHQGAVIGTVSAGGRTLAVREARDLKLPPVPNSPVGYDCNNAFFSEGGKLYCFTSHEHPYRSVGSDLRSLESPPQRVSFDNEIGWTKGGRWIEAVHKVPGGRLYMWYHNEPHDVIPGRPDLTVPRIGQMVSDDLGLHWHDQGIILEASPGTIAPATTNRYFAGGVGDLSVVLDQNKEYFYFLFSTYDHDIRGQGIAIARMPYAALEDPVGQVTKWCDDRWTEPGLGGRFSTIFQAEGSWHTDQARAFWGPSIHWNTYLNEYVVVMNLSVDNAFTQGGVYITFNPRLDDPSSWTKPVKLLDETSWYPQLVGIDQPGAETDQVAGRVARLFVKGRSNYLIEFGPATGPAPSFVDHPASGELIAAGPKVTAN